MPSKNALLLVLRSQLALENAILLIQLALNNNPAADDEMALRDMLSDLETAKDALISMETQLENEDVTIPPPDPALVQAVKELSKEVEAAKNAGAAASASLAAAGEVFNLALTVMSLAK